MTSKELKEGVIEKKIKINGEYIDIHEFCKLFNVSYSNTTRKVRDGVIKGAINTSTLIPIDYVISKIWEIEQNEMKKEVLNGQD